MKPDVMIVRACVLVISAGAALMDLFMWKISNIWICIWIAAGILGAVFLFPEADLVSALLGLLFPLLLLGWLFYFRMMGGGDIKLFCTLGVWMGGTGILNGMLVSFLIGAAMAVVRLLCGKNARARFRGFFRYLAGFLSTGVRTEYEGKNDEKARVHVAVPVFLAMILWCMGVYS